MRHTPRPLNTTVFQGAAARMVEFWKDPFKGASAHGTLGQRRVLRRDKVHTSNWDDLPIGNGELGHCTLSSAERGQAGREAEQVQETRTELGNRNSRVMFTEGFSSATLSSAPLRSPPGPSTQGWFSCSDPPNLTTTLPLCHLSYCPAICSCLWLLP